MAQSTIMKDLSPEKCIRAHTTLIVAVVPQNEAETIEDGRDFITTYMIDSQVGIATDK